jgi:glycosyltransferase involved in cell wall biosynthesis
MNVAPISVLHLAAADSMIYPNLRDQLCYLRERGYRIHAACIDGRLGRRIQDDENFEWTPLPLTREFDLCGDWRALRFIRDFCKREKFDIVHTHTPKGNLIGQWAARRAGVPIVLQTLHGFYFHDRMDAVRRRIWMAIERFSASHSDHILCQNPEDVETALSHKIVRPDQISLLGNGIDISQFKCVWDTSALRISKRRELKIPENAWVVGMVGRFVEEKGFPEFLAAGVELCKQFPQIYLLAVGHKMESERKADRWTPQWPDVLAGRLIVLTDRDDMSELYGCMDVHVLPSHREGFPRALMEGAATGLPQVATDIRGCRQTVEEGRTGFLMDVGDVQALTSRVKRLVLDATLRRQMGEAARQKAVAEFDQIKVFEKVDACYQTLIKQNRQGSL